MLFDPLRIFFSGKRPIPVRRRKRSLPAAQRKVAVEWFTARTTEWAEYMGMDFKAVRVRDMTSRWGSCSAKGFLSFNVRLLAAPGDVIDYVIVHELAHRCEMNHSPRFWAIVKRAIPEYKELRKELKSIGPGLLSDSRPLNFEGLRDARIPRPFQSADRLEGAVLDPSVL